ncbi:MAG: divalent metal cation transporter [Phycisphaerae bacterium]|jgi:Mn2+/Fe2+ NRAMP family transporter|nr:divalent metal cation transporter [Phycisphaerae bacterium]
MTTENSGADRDLQTIEKAQAKGRIATLGAYFRLSGPGWLQSAITLGGGSLGASLYLGVLAGFSLLWLQPVAMIIGIIMLSAISYVTLSTGEKPFQAIKTHVNPVLGWGWILATLLANCVWALPQFNLAWGGMTQNLMPETFSQMDPFTSKAWISGVIAVLCITIVFLYDSGGWGLKLFNILLKLMVAVIVISFVGVVVYMSKEGVLNWGAIGNGFIPDITMFWEPAERFSGILSDAGNYGEFWSTKIVNEQVDVLIAAAATAVGINMTFLLPYSMLKRGWNKKFRGLAVFDLSTGLFIPFILATGCVVIAAAAQFHHKPCVPFSAEESAIRIVDKTSTAGFADMSEEQKLAELETIVAENYKDNLKDEARKLFPGKAAAALLPIVNDQKFIGYALRADKMSVLMPVLDESGKGSVLPVDKKLLGGYKKQATARVKHEMGASAYESQFGKGSKLTKKETAALLDERIKQLPLPDRKLAAMLVRRDSIHLAKALSPLTGDVVAHYVFGIGVVGMAVSSIIILMLINGFTVCEMVDLPSKGWLYRFGCMLPAVGVLGPFIWSGAAPFLAIPTSVIGFIVIPIAYTTFALLLNQRKLLGDDMPRGLLRWFWNLLMLVGVFAVLIGSVYMAWKKTRGLPGMWGGGWVGLGGVGLFFLMVLIAHFARRGKKAPQA